MTPSPDLIIRPILLQDAEALWKIARQEGVIETMSVIAQGELKDEWLMARYR